MRTAFDDPTGFEHEDLVHGLKRGKPMRDEKRCAAFRRAQEVGGQRVCGRRVEMLGRLVENQNGKVGEQRAGHRNPLSLPAREDRAVHSHGCLELGGQALDPAAQAHQVEHPPQLLVCGMTACEQEVLAQGCVEDVRVLFDEPDDLAYVVARRRR